MNNPFDMLKNLGSVQQKLQQMETTVKETRATGEAGAGMVKVTVNGMGHVYDVSIDPALAGEDNLHTLEVLFASAANAGVEKVQQMLKEKQAEMLGNLS